MGISQALILIPVYLALLTAMETNHTCGNKSLRLSLFGKKENDGRWNTSYNLDKYSINCNRNWNFVLHQNVTEVGNVEHLHLQGFFMENVNANERNDVYSVSSLPMDSVSARNSSTDPTVIPICDDSIVKNVFNLRLVSRLEWKANHPTKAVPYYNIPVKNLYLEAAEKCSTSEECILMIQRAQKAHMAGDHGDIFYNFYIGGDGYIYEGIGWNRLRGSTLNLKYNADGPTISNTQYSSMAQLIRYGLKYRKIHAEYQITGFKAEETRNWVNSIDF